MHGPSVERSPSGYCSAARRNRIAHNEISEFRVIEPVPGHHSQLAVAEAKDVSIFGVADSSRCLDQRPEHGLEFVARAADDLENVARRGLVFEGFLKVM